MFDDDEPDEWITTFPHADPKAVCASLGEPSATERALLVVPMSDDERARFGRCIEAVADRYRQMSPSDVDRHLTELESE